MIRKYMICGQHVHFTSKAQEGDENRRVVELALPVETFWQAEKLLEDTQYMIAQSEDPVVLHSRYLDLYRKVMQYAVYEKDRLWLMDKVNRT